LITELTPAAAVRETQRSARLLSLSAFVVFACAIALFVLPSSASAFGVANFKYSTTQASGSTTAASQAAAHPNSTVSFERTGTEDEDLKNIQVDMPAGTLANPESVAQKCTTAQFKADSCPSASNVGTVSVGVKAMGLLPLTINGTVDIVQPNPDAIATLGISLRPDKICILFVFCAVPEKIFLETDASLNTWGPNGADGDHGLTTDTSGSPKKSKIGIPLIVWTPTIDGDITVNSMALSFQARSGDWTTRKECTTFLFIKTCKDIPVPPAGNYFWQNSTSCAPAQAKVTITSYQGVQKSATTPVTPTGCNNVPFDPQLSFTPANTDSNKSTAVDFVMTLPEADAPIQNSFPRFVDADLPAGSGLDLNALSGVTNCTDAQLKAKACPASSQIGTTYAYSKFMPGTPASAPGLTGKVYATSVTSQVEMAVLLDGPRGTQILLRGVMGARDGHVYSTFTTIPQVPFSKFALTITKAAYKNPVECGAAASSIKMTGYSGAVVTRPAGYTVGNCAPPPDTTIDTQFVDNKTDHSKAPLAFHSDQSGVSFQCSVDGSAWVSCASPWTTQALSLGNHTFRVKALKGVVEDLTPAEYQFEVVESSYSITPVINVETNQAVAHPDVDASVTIGGTGSPKSLSLKMPRGFAASLAAVPLCDAATAAPVGNCTNASKIGTIEAEIVNSVGATEIKTGNLFLTDGPNASSDAGGVATVITGFSDGDIVATGGAFLVENGAHQYLELRNIPNSFSNGHAFQAKKLTLHLDGVTSGGENFLTNPSNCDESAWDASSINHSDVETAAFNVPFQATGCENVPFGPQLLQTLSNPVAGQATGVNANLQMAAVPSGSIVDRNSAVQSLTVLEPRVIAPNFPSFGEPTDQCSVSTVTEEGLFDPTGCPAQAKVGTMTINTPLLADPLEGTVWLIEASPIPWLGVVFDQPGINVSMVGITSTPKVNPSCNPLTTPGGCPTRISISFDGVPDVQIDSIDMDLNGADRDVLDGGGNVVNTLSGKILQLAAPTDKGCNKISVASTIITSHSDPGTAITQNQTINIPNCNF
jgi:hypothetical protein